VATNAAQRRHVVTAVVVAHDGARLLPALVRALRQQTYPVHRAVGVDTGSGDRSGAVLTALLGRDAVFGMDPQTGFGAAVARALQHPAARVPVPGPDPPAEWVWLLHDDCEPAADALEQLLRAAARSASAAVLGPKLRDLADRRVLREAGITTDRAGRRLTGIEPGEVDQGQHDGNRAVLAVGSAGMLVRRDVWERLGGFDGNLPLFRDDIDFCWRARAAGYDVRVVTDAVVYHRELSARQARRVSAAGGHPRLLDRRAALYVFAANLPFGPMLRVVGGCIAGSLLRAAFFLLTKQQRMAWAHLGAVAWLLRHPVLLWRARRRRAAGRAQAYAVLRDRLPRGRTVARLAEAAAGALSRGPGDTGGGLHQAAADDTGDDLPLPVADSVTRRVLTSPAVLLVAGLTLVALVAERSLAGAVLAGSGTLGGGTLVPAWGGASDLWREYLAGYHGAGLGSAASAPPYLAVVAAVAAVLGGKPWLAVDVLLLGCVPAAGLSAFLAARRVTSVLPARIWLAAGYALLPVAMGAVAAGRIGTAVAFVLLPPIGAAIGRIVAGPPPGCPSRFTARQAAWAAALLIAVAAAFVPLIWLMAVAGAAAALAASRWLGRATVINAAIAAAVPAALLVPWTFHLLASPSAFLGEAGLAWPGLAAAALRPASVLLLSPGGPGLPPAWVTAGLALPAFCALLARRRTALVYTGWGIALCGLALTLAVSRATVTPPQGGTAVSAWPGIATAVAAAGLLLAAAPLVEAAAVARPARAGGPPGARHHGGNRGGDAGGPRGVAAPGLALLAAAASAPLLAAGYWLAYGVRGPVSAAGPPLLPPFVAAASSGPDRSRTLVLRPEDGVLTYAVLRDADPLLGEPELPQAAAATRALDGAVAWLAAAGGGAGQALGGFGIGYVLLPAPVDQALARRLDGDAGLVPLVTAPGYDLWRVTGTAARARVITAAGAVVPVPSGAIGVQAIIPPGVSGTLVLAEPAGGWSATLDGRALAPLPRPVDGWAQGFALPRGGRLVIARSQTARQVSLACQAAAVLVAFALALPGTGQPPPAPGGRREPAAGRRRRRPGPAVPGPAAPGIPSQAVPRPGMPEPGMPGVPVPGVPAAGIPAPGTPARGAPARGGPARGGQHAARHGKPPRRRRGGAGQSPAAAGRDGQSPAAAGRDGQVSTPPGLQQPAVPPGPAARSRPPWELGGPQ
jgi:GT2 family glycosyltransferase